jgi:hypothetical protein
MVAAACHATEHPGRRRGQLMIVRRLSFRLNSSQYEPTTQVSVVAISAGPRTREWSRTDRNGLRKRVRVWDITSEGACGPARPIDEYLAGDAGRAWVIPHGEGNLQVGGDQNGALVVVLMAGA